MSEGYPGASTTQSGTNYEAYQPGNLSTHEGVRVAAGSGSKAEAHADGSYGSTEKTLGELVRAAGGL